MSVPLFTMVFPDRTIEYRTGREELAVGDVIRHRGEEFVIATVDTSNGGITITLRGHDLRPEPTP